MAKAGENENHFRKIISDKFGANLLAGKKRYTLKLDGFDLVETSVDESIQLEDGRVVLIEVDSGNMAKLLAGQYALLNGLCNDDRKKTLFLVVQYYVDRKNNRNRPYSPHRTLKNLNAIQHFDPTKKWLPYNAVHAQELEKMIDGAESITTLVNQLWPNLAFVRDCAKTRSPSLLR